MTQTQIREAPEELPSRLMQLCDSLRGRRRFFLADNAGVDVNVNVGIRSVAVPPAVLSRVPGCITRA